MLEADDGKPQSAKVTKHGQGIWGHVQHNFKDNHIFLKFMTFYFKQFQSYRFLRMHEPCL